MECELCQSTENINPCEFLTPHGHGVLIKEWVKITWALCEDCEQNLIDTCEFCGERIDYDFNCPCRKKENN